MGNIFSLSFWFNTRPGLLMPIYSNIFIGFIIFLLIAFIVFSILQKKKKGAFTSFLRRLSSFSIINAIIGLILLFFVYELIPFLSARFWLLFWGIGMIVWLVTIFKKLRTVPVRKKQLEDEKEFKKYIP